jgi:hypothetical protein
MTELWHKLDFEKGYENYAVSNLGKVKNLKTGVILKPDLSDWYQRCNLFNTRTRKQKHFRVHRLVALYFVEGDNKLIINHKDGNKINNVYTNLEWVTTSENNSHAYHTGLKTQNGIKNPSNVYSEEIIHQICKMIEEGFETREISEKVFLEYNNIYKNLINHIKGKRRWITISQNYNF